MESKQTMLILFIVTITIYGFILIGAYLYAIPICLIRRFHTPLHLLSLNVCIAASVCTTFWAIYNIMSAFYPAMIYTEKLCVPFYYIQTTVNCEILYALCLVSINRLFSVIYKNKAIFRTKKWVAICVFIQWIFVPIIALPLFAANLTTCSTLGIDFHSRVYMVAIVVIIPTISLTVTNSIIFIYARRSSNRVQPMNGNNALIPALKHRDARILKHMIFMFVVLFCGWVTSYMTVLIIWNGALLQSLPYQILRILPPVGIFINIIDLFWYNHELRRYFTNKINNRLNTRTT